MYLKPVVLSWLAVCLAFVPTAQGAGNHRLLVLDVGHPGPHPDEYYRLILLDVEAGKILAQAELGYNPDIALSSKADEVAVPRVNRAEGDGLQFFRVADLSLVGQGRLPPQRPPVRSSYRDPAAPQPACRLSPDGKEVIFQCAGGDGVVLTCVSRELGTDGMFKLSRKQKSVHPFRHVDFLRVADWPKVHVWNGAFLYVVDLSSGQILSRLLLNDEPSFRGIDPKKLEMPTPSQAKSLLSHAGLVLTDGGKYAYYISHHYADDDKPGSLRKIDLSADPPKVISESKAGPQQGFGMMGVSEAAGIFLWHRIQAAYPPGPARSHAPSETL